MKFSFKNWGERIRSLLGSFGKRRPQGLASIPGETSTLAGGSIPKKPLIDWEKLYRKSFLYNSLAAIICGYFIADLLVAGFTPYFPPAEAPRARAVTQSGNKDFMAYSMVIMPMRRANLFNKDGLIPNNDAGGGDGYSNAPVKTQLPFTLLGMIVIQGDVKSVASIEDKGSNQVVAVRVGDNITPSTVVEAIGDFRVIFQNQDTGRREFVELPQDQILATRRAAPSKPVAGGIQKTSDNRYTLDRKAIDTALGDDFNKILTEARCVPEFEGGRPAGYRCFQIVPGSIYEKLGLQDNDVICGIDGEALNDPSKAFSKLAALKDSNTRSMSVCIKRNGVVTNSQFDIN